MRKVTYSMGVSLDGYIADPDGEIDFTDPDEELHRFHNERTRKLGAHLLGRRLYETMIYWETAEETEDLAEWEVEFAHLWNPLPKVVFSRTLKEVEGNATLAKGNVEDEVAKLKSETAGDIGVGGAGLASSLIERDLIDEYSLFVYPTVLGGGTPFFPAMSDRIELELAETRQFGQGVLMLRYERTDRAGS